MSKTPMRRRWRAAPGHPQSFRITDEMWQVAIDRADYEGTTVSAMIQHFIARYADGEPFEITGREYPAGPTQSVRIKDDVWARVVERCHREEVTYSDVLFFFAEAWVEGRSQMPTVVEIAHEIRSQADQDALQEALDRAENEGTEEDWSWLEPS
jgi:hypothetical protein